MSEPCPVSSPEVPGPARPTCVLGTGLIGGSILRALAAAGDRASFGWNRSAGPAEAARADGVDVSTDLPTTLRRATESDALVVVGVPMPALGAVLDAVAEYAPGVALTDVVSVKGPVLSAVRARGLAARFVGGHPMAGTTESGWAATDPDLFRGAVWFIAREADSDPVVTGRVEALAAACGARIVRGAAADHDAAVARISHLPHLAAEALALAGAADPLALRLAAGSFRDGTRVAGTAPDLVRAICEPNAAALLPVLDEYLAALTAARDALAAGGTLGPLPDAGHVAHQQYVQARRV